MHIKVPIKVVISVDVNVVSKYLKPLMQVHQVQINRLRYLHGHVYMLGKDIGTMMHLKTLVIVTFVFRIVCYSATLWVRYCSDFDTIWKISPKMNVLSNSMAHSVQPKHRFDICRNVWVIS